VEQPAGQPAWNSLGVQSFACARVGDALDGDREHQLLLANTGSHLPARRWNDFTRLHSVANTNGGRTIGKLTVHRESMRRVLTENPESLKSILNELQEALQPVNTAAQGQFEMLLGGLAQES